MKIAVDKCLELVYYFPVMLSNFFVSIIRIYFGVFKGVTFDDR